MRIEVACVAPGREELTTLDVAPGTTVADAVAQSGILARVPLPREAVGYAIHGRRVGASAVLADGDRVEITRPLACDPRLARRRRATRQG
jgi:putative ubiquitin-RnfH superfamily antitoxin RatB of RatAB toxin-antitoxin module